MTEPTTIEGCASELLDGARKLRAAAQRPGSHTAAPEALDQLEKALQVVSAAWYQLAADAALGDGRPDEAEAELVGTLQDVAAAFARSARACRDAQRLARPTERVA